MAIVDYEAKADQALKHLLACPEVSEQNKTYVSKFADTYDVSDARRFLVFTHLKRLLIAHDDIKTLISDKVATSRLFRSFKKELSPSVYATTINVSKRFAKYLNGGEPASGFRDVKTPSKKSQLRQLDPDDMVTWDEGLKLAEQTNSIQIKAVILTQLDGGFRPSEFVELRYNDVKHKQPFLIVTVRGGKTGPRDVILFRSVPYLLKWLEAHPDKNKDAPLWVQENGGNKAYEYAALQKRLRVAGEKAKLNKPLSFYNLRHSAVTLSKKDNVPEEEAARKFGHSLQHYTDTYGRLDVTDRINRYSQAYGLDEQQREAIKKNLVCARCNNNNAPSNSHCGNCGTPLSMAQALEDKTEQDHLIEEMINEKIERMLEQYGPEETGLKILASGLGVKR